MLGKASPHIGECQGELRIRRCAHTLLLASLSLFVDWSSAALTWLFGRASPNPHTAQVNTGCGEGGCAFIEEAQWLAQVLQPKSGEGESNENPKHGSSWVPSASEVYIYHYPLRYPQDHLILTIQDLIEVGRGHPKAGAAAIYLHVAVTVRHRVPSLGII